LETKNFREKCFIQKFCDFEEQIRWFDLE